MYKQYFLLHRSHVLVAGVFALVLILFYWSYNSTKTPMINVNNWETIVTHKETLVNWQDIKRLGKLTNPVDWSKIEKREPPPVDQMHDKWIVVTSIAAPTKDVEKLSKIAGWQLLVVGDTKTPENWR